MGPDEAVAVGLGFGLAGVPGTGDGPAVGLMVGGQPHYRIEAPMSVALTPYLNFDGNTREAMEFYHGVLGGELTVTSFAEGMGGEADPALADRVMHAGLFVAPGLYLMASDTMPGQPSSPNGTLSLSSADAADAATLRGYWEGLVADGTVVMPLELAPWGDMYGMLVDRFGVSWMADFVPSA